MSATKLFRPLAQGLRPMGMRSMASSSAFVRAFSGKAPAPVQSKAVMPSKKMNVVYAAMPQLVPFYFVNEVSVAFVLIPGLIYLFSKYILPQKVRLMAARLFISKL